MSFVVYKTAKLKFTRIEGEEGYETDNETLFTGRRWNGRCGGCTHYYCINQSGCYFQDTDDERSQYNFKESFDKGKRS